MSSPLATACSASRRLSWRGWCGARSGPPARAGVPLLDHRELDPNPRRELRAFFRRSVLPILIPLAVDAEHPFPFISNQGLNLAILVPGRERKRRRFVRLKGPDNRPRWVRCPRATASFPWSS